MLRRLVVVVAALVGGAALAQGVDTSALSLQGSRAEGSIAFPSARLLEKGAWEVAVGYGHDGDVVRTGTQAGDVRGSAVTQAQRWVGQRDVLWLQAAGSFLPRFEVHAALPVLLGQSAGQAADVDAPWSGGAALGDVHVGLRFALLEPKAWAERGWQWALQAGLWAPSGRGLAAFSERSARVDASTTLGFQSGGSWALQAHAGYQMGAPLQVGDQLFGDRLNLGATGFYRRGHFQLSLDALTLVQLGLAAPQTRPARASFELVAGARYLRDFFFVDLGFGVAPADDGLTPRWRAQLALGVRGRVVPPPPPPPDPDPDHDGVLGAADQCPSVPEDLDGFGDADGCPDLDDDHDGIPDARDACPRVAEDPDGVADTDGCPEEDADADGVPDAQDKCPLAAEDFDGVEDGDGCPEAAGPDPRAAYRGSALLEQAIFFEVGKATVDAGALGAVREVAATLLRERAAVEVVGHADDQGTDKVNDELSAKRAEAVKALLVEAGVPTERLQTRGAGRREPMTSAGGFGRSLNRSVTFRWVR